MFPFIQIIRRCWPLLLVLFLGSGASLQWVRAGTPARWPQFRGDQASGVNPTGHFPSFFGPRSNVLWKTALPAGHSSPCVWEEHLFVTGSSEGQLETWCLNRRDGSRRWRQAVSVDRSERGKGGSAAPTPVTDGQRVWVYFGPFGALCYDFEGKEVWRRPLPNPITQHGTGASPVLAGKLLILARDQDVDAHLLALDAATGRTTWQADRPAMRRGFSTPLPWPSEKPEVILAPGTLRLVAYDVADGRERWSVGGFPNEMVASPVGDDDRIYVAGWTPGAGVSRMPAYDALLAQGDQDGDGRLAAKEAPAGPAKMHFTYVDANKDGWVTREEWTAMTGIFEKSQNVLMAIRPGGQGEVTASHVLWKQTRGLPYVPSPLVYQGHVYLVKNGGLVSCFDARTGRICYQEERLGALGDYYASPVAAGGKILAISQAGTAVVFQAGETLTILARQDLGEPVMATPALVEHVLYLRTQKNIYAFGAAP